MSRIPRLVTFSVSLYRLLLAAYPAAFRDEYGEAMVQLFRDTTLDAYRRRGLLGLSALWLRTLADFTSSVIRQHREQTSREGETLSLRHVAQQWLALGGGLVSATVMSMRYADQVILRRPLRTCVVASTIILLFWVWSIFTDLGHFNLDRKLPLPIFGLDLEIHNGVFEFRYIYYVDEPHISWERFREIAKYRNHLMPAKPWEFSLSTGYWIYSAGKPNQYSLLRIPVPTLLVWVLLFYWGARGRLRGKTNSSAAMQSA